MRDKEARYDTVHQRMVTAEKELDRLKALAENQAAALLEANETEKVLQVGRLVGG